MVFKVRIRSSDSWFNLFSSKRSLWSARKSRNISRHWIELNSFLLNVKHFRLFKPSKVLTSNRLNWLELKSRTCKLLKSWKALSSIPFKRLLFKYNEFKFMRPLNALESNTVNLFLCNERYLKLFKSLNVPGCISVRSFSPKLSSCKLARPRKVFPSIFVSLKEFRLSFLRAGKFWNNAGSKVRLVKKLSRYKIASLDGVFRLTRLKQSSLTKSFILNRKTCQFKSCLLKHWIICLPSKLKWEIKKLDWDYELLYLILYFTSP